MKELKGVLGKLMRLDRLPVYIRFKLNSNQLLIDFYDPISAVQSNRFDESIRIRFPILILNSNLYRKVR